MSNELIRAAQKHVATRSDTTLRQEAGKGLLVGSGSAIALGAAAWVIPFVTFPFLVVMAALLGVWLYFK